MNTPVCPACHARIGWRQALGQVLGPGRHDHALWGAVCAACGARLKVPTTRVMLIFASGIFFGSQTSVLLTLGDFSTWETIVIRILLIIGFYVIAGLFFFSLEEAS